MDINSDGKLDIVTGTYSGRMIMYQGMDNGFIPQREIEQTTDLSDKSNMYEYLYTNPTFADFNDDGLLDAFLGGYKGIRVMINEGTASNPRFGKRTQLLHLDGKPLYIRDFTGMRFDKKNKSNEN